MTSYYELTHPLGKIRPQSFIDTFDGDSLRSWWNFTNGQGSGSGAMEDVSNNGYKITTGANINDRSSINFNNIRPFSNTSLIIISMKRNTASTSMHAGLNSGLAFGSDHWSLALDATNQTFKSLYTKDGTTENVTATTVAVDTNWTEYSISMEGTVLNKLYINGDFGCIRTSQLANTNMQPNMRVYAITSGAKTGNIKYFEVFNR